MNKRSVKKKRPAKAGVAVRKSNASRTGSQAPGDARQSRARKPQPDRGRPASESRGPISAREAPLRMRKMTTVTVARSDGAERRRCGRHKFRVGQTVSYTSSPISRPGASGSYQVVRLLPSDGDDYQYRIKNPGEAFERVAKESQLELEH